MGLQWEVFTRRKACPQGLDLTPMEEEWFTGEPVAARDKKGRPATHWRARRVEINAVANDLTVRLEREGFVGRAVRPKRPVRWVARALEREPQQGWQGAMEATARRSMRAHLEAHKPGLEAAITEALRAQLEGIEGEEEAAG
jgi:hypothetical protein